jgi:uncharacterized protein YqcC (DUF446 family)
MEKLYLLDKIIQAIKEWRSTNPREEDINKLYINVKKYYKRLKEACEKDSKVYRLASDIAKDDLFCIALEHDNYEKILAYLTNLDNLTKGQKSSKNRCATSYYVFLNMFGKNF